MARRTGKVDRRTKNVLKANPQVLQAPAPVAEKGECKKLTTCNDYDEIEIIAPIIPSNLGIFEL